MVDFNKLFLPDYKEIKVLKKLSSEEIEEINKKYELSFLSNLKKFIKKTIFLFLKNLSLIKIFKFSTPRSLQSVHWKYEQLAGSYIKNHRNSNKLNFIAINEKKQIIKCQGLITNYYATCLKKLYILFKSKSILEVGAGELTTMDELLKKLNKKKIFPKKTGAIDISLKRLILGKKFVKSNKRNINLIARANASRLPFPNNSFDMVYTANCLEQVPSLFTKSLKELVRVSSNLIVIIEPSYQFGSKPSKDNIIRKGYTKINDYHFKELGLKPIYRNILNLSYYISGTEITILKKKKTNKKRNNNNFVCPISHENLYKEGSFYKNKKGNIKYAIKNLVPMLCEDDKIKHS